MISSIVENTAHKCPMCGSDAVRSRVKAYPEIGLLSKAYCDTCGFWVCNCAFRQGDDVEYRGFAKEGVIPPDLPMSMKEDIVLWT